MVPFRYNCTFWFSYMLHWWTWSFSGKKILKKRKLKISKTIRNSTFWGLLRKCEIIWKRFEGVTFWKFCPHSVQCERKRKKKYRENLIFSFIFLYSFQKKSPSVYCPGQPTTAIWKTSAWWVHNDVHVWHRRRTGGQFLISWAPLSRATCKQSLAAITIKEAPGHNCTFFRQLSHIQLSFSDSYMHFNRFAFLQNIYDIVRGKLV